MSKRHEQLLYRYSSALERGDFETVADVLREAERDPDLEAMLLDLNAAYTADQSERFAPNGRHRNPKEIDMIAPLYPIRTPERLRPYNLPMIAALALVMLVGVLLATRLAPPTNWNTAQNGSPAPNVAQGIADECEHNGSAEPRLELYSRPAADARMIHQYVGLYVPQSALMQMDAAEVEGQTWYFVSISDGLGTAQGWVTAAAYNQNVCCAPLVNGEIMTRAVEEGVITSTPTPFDEALMMSATAVVAQASALPPTVVPPDMMATATPLPFGGVEPTVVPPADVQAVPMITTCTIVSNQSLEVHVDASDDSMVLVTLPAGTAFEVNEQVNQPDSPWVRITAEVQGITISGGWLRLDEIDFVTDCTTGAEANVQTVDMLATPTPVPFDGSVPTLIPADGQEFATFTPTPVPFSGNATALPPTVVPLAELSAPEVVPAVPTVVPMEGNANIYGFPIYTVQEGDTLGSILMQFNLGIESLNELLFINELTGETVELPEMLLIPVNLSDGLPLCKSVTAAALDVHTEPNSDTAILITLPAYTVFEEGARVTQADNRTWRQIRARLRNDSIIAGWITLDATFYVGECRVPMGEVLTASQSVTTTPTPMPTIVPLTSTPTPAR